MTMKGGRGTQPGRRPNWLLLSNASPTTQTLSLKATGSGGIPELLSHLSPTEVQYAYVRIQYANDAESVRVKFALIIWIGEQTKVMRKARVSIESGEVKRVLAHHSITVDASEVRDIDEEEIVRRLRKAGGADYNGGRG
ncbi:actin depolymerizing protein [Neurospora tetrasperma FGSC 2509]|nr:actin depolymerizing protein [Neurospora tetrasperma FGSC 2509]